MSVPKLSLLTTTIYSKPQVILPSEKSTTDRSSQKFLSSKPTSININSTQHIPSSNQTSSNFVYLSKSKTRNFIMTENFLQHKQDQKRDPLSARSRLSQLDPLNICSTPRTSFLSPENTPRGPPLSPRDLVSPSSERRSRNRSSITLKGDVFEELKAAGESHAKMNKLMTSLNHKKQMLADQEKGDKTSLLIKHHKHRLYGIDFLNLKKLHSILKPSQVTSKSKENKKVTDNLPNNKNGPTAQMTKLKKLNMANVANINVEDEPIPPILKDHVPYTYNPVIDGFQYSGHSPKELDQFLMSFTANKKDKKESISISPRVSVRNSKRLKLKSQTIALVAGSPSKIPIVEDVPIPKSPSPTLNAKSPSLVLKRRGSEGKVVKIGERVGLSGAVTERVWRESFPNISISAEESIEEQSKRIIAHTYRHYDEGVQSKINFGRFEDKMKKIGELCGKLEAQNKRMMRKVNRSEVKLGKEFRKLNNRVNSIVEPKLKL